MPQHNPIALFEIAHLAREGGERHGVGSEEHFALAMADRERRAAPGAD